MYTCFDPWLLFLTLCVCFPTTKRKSESVGQFGHLAGIRFQYTATRKKIMTIFHLAVTSKEFSKWTCIITQPKRRSLQQDAQDSENFDLCTV